MDQCTKIKCTLRVKMKFPIQIFLISLIFYSNVESLDLSQCTMPLGMESYEIADSDITASSSYENGNVGPFLGRVRTENQGGAWCPKNQITSEGEEWLQIDLHTTRVITETETQGRFGNGQGLEFAETYMLSYWRPQLNKFVRYRDHTGNEILKGNINTYLAAKTELNPPIIASKIRIIPYSYHRRTVCMRVEIYGCPYRGGLQSYAMPQGSKLGENWELYDFSYDGQWEGQYLQYGLGQLVDGKGGPVDFKDDYYAENGKGWVGWRNDSRNDTNPLEILFNFDAVREFNSVHIHTSNQFTKEIMVFSEARIFFSIGGKLFPGAAIAFVPSEDCIFEDPKNITIKLHHRIARYVKIQLFWASKWMLISEITFDSQPAIGNFTDEGSLLVGNGSSTKETKDTLNNSQTNVSSRVVIDNPELPINVANSVVDRTPTLVEEFSSSTVVITAVISSCIAILLVLVMILAAFLLRNRIFVQEKIPPPSQPNSVHYGEVGFSNGIGFPGCQSDFGYAAPLVLLASRGDTKSKSPQTMASSLSRDYEPFKAFSSFVGSNANNTAAKSNGGSISSSGNSKTAEYYSCALLPNPNFINKTDLKASDYEYVSNEGDFNLVSTSHKNPRRNRSPDTSLSPPPMFRGHHNISLRLRELGLPEIPKENLILLKQVGQGIFGTIFIGELHWSNTMDRHLVTVKRLLRNASEKDKMDFLTEVRLLSTLKDPNVTQVMGLCTEEEPFSVALEFLELGDLCQFLRQNDTLQSASKRKLSDGDLLHLGSQIASGMKFLESKNIVHRDLATRNCVVSRCLTVKISHFVSDTGLYSQDYYQIDGKMGLPLRWMAWESIFLGKYSTKSDVWSMGVLLWEILTFCRQSPYPSFTDQEVIHNARRLSLDDDADPFQLLNHPYNCPRDVYELMCDTWKRNDVERPSFWEIHCFLMRKNMNYCNKTSHPNSRTTTNKSEARTSYYV